MLPDPLIERAFMTPDGLMGCQVYWDGGKWVHRHIPMCPERYKEELKFKEYRNIRGTKVSRVKLQLSDWGCVRERKYRFISKAIERLALEPAGPITYLPVAVYFGECLNRDGWRDSVRDDETVRHGDGETASW